MSISNKIIDNRRSVHCCLTRYGWRGIQNEQAWHLINHFLPTLLKVITQNQVWRPVFLTPTIRGHNYGHRYILSTTPTIRFLGRESKIALHTPIIPDLTHPSIPTCAMSTKSRRWLEERQILRSSRHRVVRSRLVSLLNNVRSISSILLGPVAKKRTCLAGRPRICQGVLLRIR